MTIGLREVIALIVLTGFILVVLLVQHRLMRTRRMAGNLLVSYFTLLLILAAGEGYFRYFHADSEGRLASERWMDLYWHLNSRGFRDREWTPEDWAGKQTVQVLGDSFTAGWGVENPADRYSDVLAGLLGDDYAVINLSRAGTATPQQLEILQEYPLQNPDVVILQYFLNDIDYSLISQGIYHDINEPPLLARESHLANYVFARSHPGMGDRYWDQEYGAYDNFVIWDIHEAELNAFIDYVDGIGARLIVVIFPNLEDPYRSIAYVDRVAQVFESRGVSDVLKLFDDAAAWNPADLVVSSHDAHPSAAFHRYVGQKIYDLYFADN